MPMYLRNNLTIAPPSIGELPDDELDDYLQDPEQLRDVLPQPYRMLDKVIQNVLDKAWTIISSREKERVAEASRIRPPQYACTTTMQEHGTATCLCESPDGSSIIVGLPNGLAAFDALTQSSVDVWTEENMNITGLHVSLLDSNVYLICTVDDMGVGRIFSLAGGRLFLMQVTNEVQSGETSLRAAKFEAAMDGSYVGIHYENSSSREGFLEVHKTPKEIWLKELEGINAKTSIKTQVMTPPPVKESEVPPSPSTGGDGGEGEGEMAVGTMPPGGEERNMKFTPTTLILKAKPTTQVQGTTSSSQLSLSKSSDLGDVIGMGTNHLVSLQHLEGRDSMFGHHHQQHMKYLPKEEKQPFREPHFHFMTPGRMMPQGLENPLQASGPTSVAVWWTTSQKFLYYSLLKTGKAEEEDPLTVGKNVKKTKKPGIISETEKDPDHKPDLVWPMSHNIVASAITPCSSLVALGLSSGLVVVWDKHLGMERRVIHLTNNSEITKVAFLNAGVCPQETGNYPPYGTYVNVYLLVSCQDSQMFLIECQLNKQMSPVHVTQAIENKDERYSSIRMVAGMPNFVLACRQDGVVFLINLLSGRVSGEITLPEGYQLTSPWNPVIAVGGKGQTVYFKAEVRADKEQRSLEEGRPVLCVFHLQQCYALDRHRIKQYPNLPFTVQSTIQDRVDALFTERLSQQSLRKDRMQARWGQMKEELELMVHLRQQAANHTQTNVYASSSIERSIVIEAMSAHRFLTV